VPGIGQRKVATYGEEILQLVANDGVPLNGGRR